MSKKQWIVLLMLFLAYLLLGASIFYHIESKLEIEHIELARQERIEINALLRKHYIPSRTHNQHEIFARLTEYCGKSVDNYTDGENDPLKWDFYNSFYFAYTVVSTIGQDNTKGSGFFFVMYKTFLIIWISFGLGYIVMIMTYIAQGMRSKKIIRIEHKLAMNLKHTQSKIWNEFNKEINYFRRVFNELQLSKVKRVYVDEYNYETPPTKFSRSNSFPDLRKLIYGGFEAPAPLHPRRRANSEVVPLEPLTRVVSETDLQRIDKTATFAAHAMVQPAELLARLVNILGYIPPPDDANDTSDWDQEYKNKEDPRKTGIEGFNEKDILNKQNTWNESSWRIGTDRISGIKPRSRAASEVRLDMTKNDSNVHQQNGEWTWSGPTASRKIQEFIKTRRTGLSGIKDSKSYKFPSITLPKSVPKNLFSPWRRQSSNKKIPDTEQSIQKGTLPDLDFEAGENYSSITAHSDLYSSNLDDVNESTTTSRHPYYTHTGANLPSLMESNNILEETSLADFLRALTVLHAKISTVPSDYSNIRKPQRKMGTASLTPPKLPSLFTLFSQSADSQSHSQSNQSTMTASSLQANRRYSLRPSEYSSSSTPSYERRGSAMSPIKSRRFSLRPVATPTNTPPEYTASYLNSRIHDDQRSQFSSLTDAFIYESAKKPLVQMEGTPGVSSPIAKISNVRRYSLRPMTQIQQPPSSNQQTQATKALPRWKAGMLQRQIGRMSVRRRVRAFSLSDVQADKSERSTGLSPLAIDDNGKPITSIVSSIKPNASAVQKTVTIVSPTKDEVLRSNSNESTSVKTTSNPFIPSFATSETRDNDSTGDNFPFRNIQNDAINTNIVLNTLRTTSECEVDYNNDSSKRAKSKSNERSVENINNSEGMGEKLIFRNDSVGSKEILNDELPLSKDVLSNIKDNSENDAKSTIRCTTNKKPRISIDSYKTSLDVKIEKPSVNPFLQYQATTSGSQHGNTNLTEVKVEKPNETEQFVQRKLSAEARKPWEKG